MTSDANPDQTRLGRARSELPEHKIVGAWRKDDSELIADATLFWQEMDVLPEDVTAEDRAKQLVCLAYDNETVVGVATAAIGLHPPLRQKFAFWRVLVHPDYRERGLRITISHYVHSFFEVWSKDHPEEDFAGVIGVVSSTYPRPNGTHPVGRASRAVIVGHNTRNQFIRVKWFDHVRV